MKFSVFFAAVIVSLCAISIARANLVTNGSFEDPVVSESASPPDPLVTSVTGWTTLYGNFNLCGINSWDSAVGNQNLDLAGDTNGSLTQTITTVEGQEYSLSFYYSDNPYMSLPSTANVTVIDNSTEYVLIDQDFYGPGANSLTDMQWQLLTVNFTATSTSTALTFEALSPNGYASPTLDGVEINTVPEPTTVALLAGGVMLLAVGQRRK